MIVQGQTWRSSSVSRHGHPQCPHTFGRVVFFPPSCNLIPHQWSQLWLSYTTYIHVHIHIHKHIYTSICRRDVVSSVSRSLSGPLEAADSVSSQREKKEIKSHTWSSLSDLRSAAANAALKQREKRNEDSKESTTSVHIGPRLVLVPEEHETFPSRLSARQQDDKTTARKPFCGQRQTLRLWRDLSSTHTFINKPTDSHTDQIHLSAHTQAFSLA